MKIGATKNFLQGKLNKTDEGELHMAIYEEKEKIVINFGKDLNWIGFSKDEAIALSKILINKAKNI